MEVPCCQDGIMNALLFLLPLAQAEPDVEVLVLGTVHQKHASSKLYDYRDVARIMEAFDPAVICVEIRPEDFRVKPYLEEMMMATLWGLAESRPVVPVDWWSDTPNDRVLREQMSHTRDFKRKSRKEERLEAQDPLLNTFRVRWGEEFWNTDQDAAFWNGPEYNDYVRRGYQISMQIWGDSPVNLHYQSRNEKMMARIEAALPTTGGKVMVLTGSEHKHFFDDALARRPNTRVVHFQEVLPRPEAPLPTLVEEFLEARDIGPYFEDPSPAQIDPWFSRALVPLVHGPDMDKDPWIIPAANVVRARKVVDAWSQKGSTSAWLHFEQAWVLFLERKPADALPLLEALQTEATLLQDSRMGPFFAAILPLSLGRCLDLMGRREEAIAAYTRGQDALAKPFIEYLAETFTAGLKTPFSFEGH